jgi:mannosyltransferase OCH1-like enzyme
MHKSGSNLKPAAFHFNYREEMQEISDDKAINRIVWQIYSLSQLDSVVLEYRD